MKPVRFRRDAVETMIAHARRVAPRECCGLLVGRGERVLRAVPARNVHPGPTRYRIDPADHFAAIKAARAEALSVVGAYHSHPASGIAPSPTDLEESVGPGFLYVIVSLAGADPEVGAYWLGPAGSERLDLVVE